MRGINMNKLIKTLLILGLLVSAASAAILTEYFQDERTVEVAPWMSFEVSHDPAELTYGTTQLHDYINITSHKKYSTTCEIDTKILFNGDELTDTEGIRVDYSVESGSGSLVTPMDYNENGMPEAAVFGTQDADGIYTIRRNILINEDLVPGTYRIITVLIPHQGNS